MSLIFATLLLTGSGSDHAAAEAVKSFAAAGDRRDLEALDRVLHDEFRVSFVVKGTEKASVMSKSDYLGLAEAKKLGGDTRALKVLNVDVQDNLAFVRVRLVGKKATFESVQTVLKNGEDWKILGETVLFAPKG
ncbi:MAG: nuclear transport factor 2 family protein [Myxococcota bacterium]